MSRALLVLYSDAMRAKAIDWIRRAPKETRVTFQGPKRTLPQNDRMWWLVSMLSDQVKWHGQKLSPEDWKVLMLSGLSQEMRVVPNLAGTGFVPLGRSSSRLSVQEMADLITLIEAFCAERGIEIPEREDAA